MSSYYLKAFKVDGLWGYKDFDIQLNKDVNIIIGPNASGKTTLLNLMRFVFSADLDSLMDIDFEEIEIKLKSFSSESYRTIKVSQDNEFITYFLSQQKFQFKVPALHSTSDVRERKNRARRYWERSLDYRELVTGLQKLVYAVWLPVSRRLPIQEYDEGEFVYARRKSQIELESVDVRLRELLEELSRYRLRLEAKLSEYYKEFEKRVLRMILYNKKHDQLDEIPMESPTQEDKEQLLRAFKAAGLLDKQMERRIDEHFSVAHEVLERLLREIVVEGSANIVLDAETAFIIPLIGRTKSIVEFARELEEERLLLFEPLRKYEEIVNSFLQGKIVRIDENGNFNVHMASTNQEVRLLHLSSGEKQLLILLTQALLWEDKPVVYVADEPELSLHVTWQENLLQSLIILGNNIQIIVATHSPDIVGPYVDKVITLGGKE